MNALDKVESHALGAIGDLIQFSFKYNMIWLID